jgi:hypothetical protein
MKTTVKIYKQGNGITFSPSFEISPIDVKEKTNDVNLIEYCDNLVEYAEFCSNQTTTGQKRKNQRRKKRNQLLALDLEKAYVFKLYDEIKRQIFEQKKAELPVYDCKIEFDGRQKKNLYKFKQAIALDLNVGGISPQYYKIGLRGYEILK